MQILLLTKHLCPNRNSGATEFPAIKSIMPDSLAVSLQIHISLRSGEPENEFFNCPQLPRKVVMIAGQLRDDVCGSPQSRNGLGLFEDQLLIIPRGEFPPNLMQSLRFPLAKDGCFSCWFKKGALFRRIRRPSVVVAVLSGVVAFSHHPLHGGLVYWGSQGFVENTDSRSRVWTADFTMVLGVFSKDFVPLPENRELWLANWTELSVAQFDAEETRFAGVADFSIRLPAHADSKVYLWARNGLDLTKGPEWLLVTQPDWIWPSSSPPDLPAITWTTGSSETVVMGAVGLNGSHLLTSRATPVPIPQQTWLQSFFPSLLTVVDPNADSDGDGIINSLEYHLGTNPNDGSSSSSPQIAPTPDAAVVTLKRNPYADSECIMESSSDLKTWIRPDPEVLADRPDLLEMRVPRDSSENAVFFRFNFKPIER